MAGEELIARLWWLVGISGRTSSGPRALGLSPVLLARDLIPVSRWDVSSLISAVMLLAGEELIARL